ncbi:MAG TPA: DUF4097 family beta strand repeat-containing protein [Balneolaceae bacterium]|nr:DUF4097 family beta strand repeat-containing protein [Balneolaceae bacterium]
MNKVTSLLAALLLSVAFQAARAQSFEYNLGNSSNKAVEFSISRSQISVEGYSGDKVVIKNNDYQAPPERAKGLHPLYGGGEDNTGIGLSVENDDGVLKVVQASSNGGDFVVKIPNKVRISIEQVNWGGGGDISVKNHDGEIEIKSKTSDINLRNVTGPVIASSTSGDADITFSSVSKANPTSISLVSGYIDITMPASTKANLKLSSISGEIYTNMDIATSGDKKDMMRLGGGHEIDGSLNGGGVEMDLKSVSGDIYLRKANSK